MKVGVIGAGTMGTGHCYRHLLQSEGYEVASLRYHSRSGLHGGKEKIAKAAHDRLGTERQEDPGRG